MKPSQLLDNLVSLNRSGMEFLSQGSYALCYKKLKAAELLVTKARVPQDIHVDDHQKLHTLTLNNLGCYYKK